MTPKQKHSLFFEVNDKDDSIHIILKRKAPYANLLDYILVVCIGFIFLRTKAIFEMHFIMLFVFSTMVFILSIRFLQRLYKTVEERIVIFPCSHLLLIRKRWIGIKSKRVLPISSVDFFFIHEGIVSNTVEYYVGAKLKDSKEVVLLCPRIHAPLNFLVPVYRNLKYYLNISTTLPSFTNIISY
jgi:hypothetical protein